ncbi:MAG: phosphate acyltransferase [Elusimicrobiota bacterium]
MWIEKIRKEAAGHKKSLIFPEGKDSRVIRAAKTVRDMGIADVTVMSDKEEAGLDTIICEENVLKAAAQMVSAGEYDGMVAGAVNTTADVVRASIKNIGVDPEISVVSSFFIMESGNTSIGENGAFLFADCAIIPEPDARKLAGIAHATANNARLLMGWEPRVAFLSFSTKGSSKHNEALKVADAVKELEKRKPDYLYDGELQLDTALVPEIAQKKDPEGLLGGKANILIFPDLNSANIAYKITERLGGYRAVGPILQGFKKPVNDLSRGCSVDDIVDVAAVTVLQAIR